MKNYFMSLGAILFEFFFLISLSKKSIEARGVRISWFIVAV